MPTIAHRSLHDGGLAFTELLPAPHRQGWRSRQDCLPFLPPARIIAAETLKAGKMGNDHHTKPVVPTMPIPRNLGRGAYGSAVRNELLR